VRERRTADACTDRRCAHARCWIEEAHVSELTGPLREGSAGDQLASWPASMRVFARRERPHPGAQLSLFETGDGWRYSLWVSNVPAGLHGWRAQLGYIDAAHRVHARVEDGIRTGKDCGIGRFPSHDFAMNSAWLAVSLIAAALLSWLRLIALDGDLARAEPRTLRYRILHAAGKLVRGGRRRRLKIPGPGPGQAPSPPLGPGSPPCHRTPDQRKASTATRKEKPRGPWNPRPPARQPGHRHTPTLMNYRSSFISSSHWLAAVKVRMAVTALVAAMPEAKGLGSGKYANQRHAERR
jgi:hypothetical protein